MSARDYRPDIDGLRAIAVGAVVAFHADFPQFSGGFVGVDVFFVISGYLITTLILAERSAGRFSLRAFYRRRAARLLPALTLTLLATLALGFFLLAPPVFANVGKQLLFSAAGAANLLFAQGLGGFAGDPTALPLMHLWSLGVEEQFYLVWPPLLLLALAAGWRRTRIAAAALALAGASLALSEHATGAAPLHAYFMPHLRAYELLIGAVVALASRSGGVPARVAPAARELLCLTGVALFAVPMTLYDIGWRFPGVNALWPCLGTALVIAAAPGTRCATLLAWRPLVWVGLLSYPLYLYHQPLLAFVTLFGGANSPPARLAWVAAVAVPLSWLSWRYVERPLRRAARSGGPRSRRILVALLLVLAGVAAAGALLSAQRGWPWRYQMLAAFAG